ncbi:PEST proteolytic signal-containing nuclear protein-like [Oscarella lobularis]|uniref:PEST proteolytic signal-containing nuclear protein-like n=1 Tax=Oscarella lobularis TaxID=121494 RepID=UPI003313E012
MDKSKGGESSSKEIISKERKRKLERKDDDRNTDALSKEDVSKGIAMKMEKTQKVQSEFKKKKEIETNLKPKLGAVAKAFNDSDSEEEEMPPEAKLRMRNIGRDTPTATGPMSFGKNRSGFSNSYSEWLMTQRLVLGPGLGNRPEDKPS